MGFFSRSESLGSAPLVVSDLDRLLDTTVGARLHGKVHKIRPITQFQFLEFAQGIDRLTALTKEKTLDPRELIKRYYLLFKTVMPSIKRSDLEKCSTQQIAALTDFVLSTVMGRDKAEMDKKKILDSIPKEILYTPTLPSGLRNIVVILGVSQTLLLGKLLFDFLHFLK